MSSTGKASVQFFQSLLICLDLHPAAAPITLLPAPELPINGVQADWNPGREPGERGDQTFSVGFAGSFEAKHQLGKTSS
jgi:hypothetical protein